MNDVPKRFRIEEWTRRGYEIIGYVTAINGPDALIKAWAKWPSTFPSKDYPRGRVRARRVVE